MASKSIYEVHFDGICVILVVWDIDGVIRYCKDNQVNPTKIERIAYNISFVDLTV